MTHLCTCVHILDNGLVGNLAHQAGVLASFFQMSKKLSQNNCSAAISQASDKWGFSIGHFGYDKSNYFCTNLHLMSYSCTPLVRRVCSVILLEQTVKTADGASLLWFDKLPLRARSTFVSRIAVSLLT